MKPIGSPIRILAVVLPRSKIPSHSWAQTSIPAGNLKWILRARQKSTWFKLHIRLQLAAGRRCPGLDFTVVSDFVSAVEFIHDHRPSACRGSIQYFRRLLSQRLVSPLFIIEGEVLRQADRQFSHRGIALLQIHVLMFDASPEPLNEDIIECPPASPILGGCPRTRLLTIGAM